MFSRNDYTRNNGATQKAHLLSLYNHTNYTMQSKIESLQLVKLGLYFNSISITVICNVAAWIEPS
jgi:hypothetical protein